MNFSLKLIFSVISFIFFLSIFTPSQGFTQDVLYKTNGTNVLVDVISADDDEVEFKLYDDPDGPVYSIRGFKLRRILYEDGTLVDYGNPLIRNSDRDVVDYGPAQGSEMNPATKNEYYVQGRKDSQAYYTKYKGAGTGVLLTSLASPLLGLIPAAATSSVPPKDHNLNYPNRDLRDNYDYRAGYNEAARKRKNKAVWNNWLIGLGVNIIVALALLSGE